MKLKKQVNSRIHINPYQPYYHTNTRIHIPYQPYIHSGTDITTGVTTNSATATKCVSLYDLRGIH